VVQQTLTDKGLLFFVNQNTLLSVLFHFVEICGQEIRPADGFPGGANDGYE
jgi:hypothetical protein